MPRSLPIPSRTCEVCGQEFTPRRRDLPSQPVRTCSKACAYRARGDAIRRRRLGEPADGLFDPEPVMPARQAHAVAHGIPARLRWLYDQLPPTEQQKVLRNRGLSNA